MRKRQKKGEEMYNGEVTEEERQREKQKGKNSGKHQERLRGTQ
jgi:hypothetical protein